MIVDLFAGPGGWSEGLRILGLHDLGIEYDAAACATRYAAGHATWQQDIAAVTDEQIRSLAGLVSGLIASPPCPDFSMAGNRAGIDGETGRLMFEVPRWVEILRPEWVACEQVPPALEWWRTFARDFRQIGYSTWVGVLNAANFGVPQTRKRAFLIASRTRAALPPDPTHSRTGGGTLFDELVPWVSMAAALGWEGEVSEIRGAGHVERYGERPPRSTDEPHMTVTGGDYKRRRYSIDRRTRSQGKDGPYPTPMVDDSRPAPTLAQAEKWVLRGGGDTGQTPIRRPSDAPAPTLAFGHDASNWQWERPATTIAGDPRVWPPGHKINQGDIDRLGYRDDTPDDYRPPSVHEHPDGCPECGCEWDDHDDGGFCAGACGGNLCHGRQFIVSLAGERYGDRAGSEAIRIEPHEALILQGFRPDYPVQGGRVKTFEQIGNAVCPPLAAAVIARLAL